MSSDQPQGPNDLVGRLEALEEQNRALSARVDQLEGGLAQERGLHRRVAELTDIVQEVLLPAPARNEGRISKLLGQYLRDQ